MADAGRESVCVPVPPPPASAGELVAHFTREERLAMYEFTLLHTQAPPAPPELLSVVSLLILCHPMFPVTFSSAHFERHRALLEFFSSILSVLFVISNP